jgi:hypothetical protein
MQSMRLSENTECIICQVGFVVPCQIQVLGCNPKHFFHKDCVNQWIDFNKSSARTPTCPMCRIDIDVSKITTKDYKGITQEVKPPMTEAEKVNDALEMFDMEVPVVEEHEFGVDKAAGVPVPHAIYSARGNNLDVPD